MENSSNGYFTSFLIPLLRSSKPLTVEQIMLSLGDSFARAKVHQHPSVSYDHASSSDTMELLSMQATSFFK